MAFLKNSFVMIYAETSYSFKSINISFFLVDKEAIGIQKYCLHSLIMMQK